MIRQNDRKERLADRFSFAAFCLSAAASAIGYGIWGLPGILISPVFVTVAFLSSPKSVAKTLPAVMACSLGMSAFIVSSVIHEEAANAVTDAFFRAASTSWSAIGAEVSSVRSSGFDARILSINGKPVEGDLEIRFYAAVDRLSQRDEVEITEWRKNAATGRKTTIPEIRADVVAIKSPHPDGISKTRSWLGGVTDRIFPRKEAGLAKGILFGDGTGISEEEYVRYRTSGLSHLVVASGGNVAVVGGMLAVFAKRLPFAARAVFLLCGIWGYAALAGSGIPVIRAALMSTVSTLCEPAFKADAVPTLLAVAAGMALWNPSIAADASFLLSFAATLGMSAVAPKISENLSFVPKSLSLKETTVATLAATVATVPVTAAAFQSLPVLSILSNVATIPVLAYAAVPTLLAIPAEAVGAHSVATALWSLGYSALAWTNAVSSRVAEVPWATVKPLGAFESSITAWAWATLLTILSFRALFLEIRPS